MTKADKFHKCAFCASDLVLDKQRTGNKTGSYFLKCTKEGCDYFIQIFKSYKDFADVDN